MRIFRGGVVFITTHDTIMNEKQLTKTIKDQNQVIIAKDATIDKLRDELKDAKCELNELYFDRSWQKMNNEWVTEAIMQKSVKIIGGFEYNTRYISVSMAIMLILMVNAFIILVLSVHGAFK